MTTVFLLSAALLLASCGFSPMYGSHSAGAQKEVRSALSDIAIENIPDQSGQYLRNELIDRLYTGGRPADPAYTLVVTPISERREDLDLTKSSDATRSQLRLTTTMELRDNRTGTILLKRQLVSATSYNILDSQFTTRVSEQNARQNALGDLARQIETQLALYFRR